MHCRFSLLQPIQEGNFKTENVAVFSAAAIDDNKLEWIAAPAQRKTVQI